MAFSRFSGKEIADFCTFLSREYGLNFPPSRYSFVENRVEPIMADFSCRTLADIILRAKRDLKLRMDLLNNLTTNETWFFRHPEHFSILQKNILPQLLESKRKTGDNRISIWSAGCSVGAELYSILFTLLDFIPHPEKFNIQLTGSDISSDALKTAKAGIFESHELRLINSTTLNRYFNERGNDKWQVKEELGKFIDWEMLNLLNSWPARNYDIIFCRNTMIYFDVDNKNRLTQRFLDSLQPGGYFFTSANETIHTEDLTGIRRLFLENEIIYQKSSERVEYRLFKFATPSDLLRALNILKNNGFEHHMEKIQQSHDLAPTRSIYLNKLEAEKVAELFALSSIKVSSTELVTR